MQTRNTNRNINRQPKAPAATNLLYVLACAASFCLLTACGAADGDKPTKPTATHKRKASAETPEPTFGGRSVSGDNRVRLTLRLEDKPMVRHLSQVNLSEVVELDASKLDLDAEDLREIAKLTQLKTLILKQNRGLGGFLDPIFTMENLEELNLASMGLRDFDLQGLEKLRLKKLILDGDPITDRTMMAIGGMPSLTWLSLGKTKITSKGIDALQQKNFRLLSFSNDDIRGALPRVIANNPKLRYLDVSATEATSADFEAIGSAANLKTLMATDSTLVTDAAVSKWSKLEKLVTVNLRASGITSAGVKAFAGWRELQTLDLSATQISDTAGSALGKLKSLRSLNVAETGMSNIGLSALSELPALGVLNASMTQVSDNATQSKFAKFPALIDLNLASTKTGDHILVAIQNLSGLMSLNLSCTEITGAGLAKLGDLRMLRKLDLTQTKVTSKDVATLKQKLPTCKILHDFN